MATEIDEHQPRPPFKETFKPREVQALLKEELTAFFGQKQYDQNLASQWSKEAAAIIKARLKALQLPRYKYLVQVIVVENRGAGVRVAARCLWDQQTDEVAQELFQNDTMYCVAAAFGVYLY